MAPREAALLEEIVDAVETRLRRASSDRYADKAGMGADGTPTKWVDQIAEEVVLEKVRASPVDVDVLTEEAGYVDHGADRTLVVDPVDGTTNAARGIPVYCISLAVGEDTLGSVDLGVIRNLATGQTFRARAGEGATLDGDPVEPIPYDPETAAVSGALRRDREPEALARAMKEGDLRDFRHLGSATLEMCFVAQGALDAYNHPSKALRVMDVAASTLVVREAGGLVLDAAGDPLEAPLDMETRRGVVAVGDEAALDHLEVIP